MLDVTKLLPEDPAELRAFTALLLAEVKSQAVLIHCPAVVCLQTMRGEKLRHQLAGQRSHRFGPSSETSDQLQLALEMSEIAIAAMTAKMRLPEDTPADKPKRKPIPDHIPRIEVELTPGNADCAQCGGKLRRLSEDVTEELEYVPGRFVVNRIVRPRMACSGCDCFTQAPLPSRPIERGRPGPGLLAHVPPLGDAKHRLPVNGSTNTPITCRFTAKARSSTAKALIWIAQHWRIGLANPRHCWSRWLMPLGAMCWRGKPSLPTTLRLRCWPPALARPKPPDSGPMGVTNALGAAPSRPPFGISSPPIAKASTPKIIWPNTLGGCTPPLGRLLRNRLPGNGRLCRV